MEVPPHCAPCSQKGNSSNVRCWQVHRIQLQRLKQRTMNQYCQHQLPTKVYVHYKSLTTFWTASLIDLLCPSNESCHKRSRKMPTAASGICVASTHTTVAAHTREQCSLNEYKAFGLPRENPLGFCSCISMILTMKSLIG